MVVKSSRPLLCYSTLQTHYNATKRLNSAPDPAIWGRGAVLPEGRQCIRNSFNSGGGGGGGGGRCSPLRAIYGGIGKLNEPNHHSHARILY